MVLPGVYQLLGDVVGDAANLLAQVDIEVLRNVHVSSSLVIVHAGAVEGGGLVAHLLDLFPPLQGGSRGGQDSSAGNDVVLVILVLVDVLVLFVGREVFGQDLLVLITLVFCPGPDVCAVAIGDGGVSLLLPRSPQSLGLGLDGGG